MTNSGAWGWGAPSCPNRTEGRATISGAPLSWSPPGGLQGETPRIGAGQFAGVARLAELRMLKRYPCGVGLACRGLMSRESAPAGGQGGGRDSRPLRGLGRAPKSACRAGPAPGSRGQGSRVGFGTKSQKLAPCVSLNFNACDFGSGASPVRGPGGESPRRGPGAELPGGVWGKAPRRG